MSMSPSIRRLLSALAVCVLLASPAVAGKGGGHAKSSGGSKIGSVHVKSYTKKNGTTVAAHTRSSPGSAKTAKSGDPKPAPRAKAATSGAVARTANGKIARSEAAKHQFEQQTGFPKGRPGYVVDHIKPLACGGADAPSNMQWQTIADAKAKDKFERVGCR